jgi:hypothetical protein
MFGAAVTMVCCFSADVSQMDNPSAHPESSIARAPAPEKRPGATWRSETTQLREQALRVASFYPFELQFGRTSPGGLLGSGLRYRTQLRTAGFGRRFSISSRRRRNRSLGTVASAICKEILWSWLRTSAPTLISFSLGPDRPHSLIGSVHLRRLWECPLLMLWTAPPRARKCR